MSKSRKAGEKVNNDKQAKAAMHKRRYKGSSSFDANHATTGFLSGLTTGGDRAALGLPAEGSELQAANISKFSGSLGSSFRKWTKKNSNTAGALGTAINNAKAGNSISHMAGDIIGNHVKGMFIDGTKKGLDHAIARYAPQLGKGVASKGLAIAGKVGSGVGNIMLAHDLASSYLNSKQGKKFVKQTFGNPSKIWEGSGMRSQEVSGGMSENPVIKSDDEYLRRARLQYANDMEKEGTYFAHKGTDDEKVQAVIDAYDDDKYGVELSDNNKALNKSSRDYIQGMANTFKQEDQDDALAHVQNHFGIANPIGNTPGLDHSQGGAKSTWEERLNKTSLSDGFKDMVKQDVNRKTAKHYKGKNIVEYGNLYKDTDNDKSNDSVHTYNVKSFQHNKFRGSTEHNPYYYSGQSHKVFETPHTDHKLTVRQAQAQPDGSPGGADELINTDYREQHHGHHQTYYTTRRTGKWKGKQYHSGRNVTSDMEDRYYIDAGEGNVLRGDYNKKQNEILAKSWGTAIGQGGLDAKPAGHTYEDYHW